MQAPANAALSLPLRRRLVRLAAVLALATSALTAFVAVTPVTYASPRAADAPSGRLVYSGDDGLYVAAGDGAGAHRIWAAPAGGQAHEPRWSPDGTRIAFAGPDGNIWTVAADGSGARALTSQAVAASGCDGDGCQQPGTAADSPRWSNDGATVSYRLVQDLGGSSIWTVPAAGGAPTKVTSAGDLCLFNEGFTPAGAPIFSRCAAAAGPSNATYMGAGSSQRPLVAGSQIAYSRDGRQLSYSSQAFSGGSVVVRLYVATSDGSGARAVHEDGQNPAWSSAGLLAYQVGGADGWSVRVYDPASGQDHAVAAGRLGGWTADGGWLYFTTVDGDGASIWVVRADGSGARRLVAGDMPDWTR